VPDICSEFYTRVTKTTHVVLYAYPNCIPCKMHIFPRRGYSPRWSFVEWWWNALLSHLLHIRALCLVRWKFITIFWENNCYGFSVCKDVIIFHVVDSFLRFKLFLAADFSWYCCLEVILRMQSLSRILSVIIRNVTAATLASQLIVSVCGVLT